MPRIIYILFAFVVVITRSTSVAYSQVGVVRPLSTSDGLGDLLVNCIYKDNQGYVWFGTECSVDCFDGNHIKSYLVSDGNYGKKRVNAILRTGTGDLYIGSEAGLHILKDYDADQIQSLLPDKITFPVNSLALYGKEKLYIATDNGLFIFNIRTGQFERVSVENDLLTKDNSFVDIAIDGELLWTATQKALYCYNIKTSKTIKYVLPVDGQCCDIAISDKKVYLGVRGSGIVAFNTITSQFEKPLKFGNNLITDVSVDPAGSLYLSTDGEGVFIYSMESGNITQISTSTAPLRLRSNSVYSMLLDNQGLLWVGYYQAGVDYTIKQNNLFSVYSLPSASFDTKGQAVRAIAIDGKQKIIGTRNGLFISDEQSGKVTHYAKPQLRSNIIFCIKSVGNRKYLIGTYEGGLYEFDAASGTISDYDSKGAIPPNVSVFSIDTDSHGSIWVGTSDGLIHAYGNRKFERFTFTNSQLPQGNVYKVYFDSAGRGWICTENGLAIWNGETIRSDCFPHDFIHKQEIRDIFEDSSHELYFAPYRGPLFRSNLQMSKYETIKVSSDVNVVTMSIIEDDSGWLWLGTDRGLIRHDKKDIFNHYNIADGLPNQVFTLCQPIKDKYGNIYIGNSSGLSVIDFKKFKSFDSDSVKHVYITDIISNGKRIMSRVNKMKNMLSLSLSHDENDITIHVSDFSYTPTRYFFTEYKLEGTDDKWHLTNGTSPIRLYNIPSGDSKLKIRAQNNPQTEFILTIRKQAQSSRQLMIAIILIMIIAGGVCTYYIMKKNKRNPTSDAKNGTITTADNNENDAVVNNGIKAEKQSYRTSRLSDEECKRLLKILRKVMEQDKPYTNPDLKSSDLASLAGITSHALSFLLNQYLHKSYYNYVNEYRVEEFKKLVTDTDIDISKYTLTALSQKCGFSSRASFFRHFKALTGITPAEFLNRK